MKKFMILAVASVVLAGCMSDNKAWLRAKELELKSQTQSSEAVIEGPAEMKIEQGGKATFKR